MSRNTCHRLLLIAVSLVLLLGVACAGDPVAEVVKARSEYNVRLTNFLPQYPEPEPVVEDAMALDAENAAEASADAAAEMADTDPADAEMADAEMADAEMTEVDMAPQPIPVLFDLVVGFEGSTSLPGVTVDVIQQDSAGNEKTRRRHYVETPGLRRGSDQQVAFQLDGLMVEDGDSFGVAIPMVPEAERASLREFAEAGQ